MNRSTTRHSRTTRLAGATGLLAAGVISGGVLAWSFSSNAATPSSSSSTTTTSSASSSAAANSASSRGNFPAHGTVAHESKEKPVTGANATKAQAAAVKSVGNGTAGAVSTDVSGSGYEVVVTKTDGSKVEVHLDKSFGVDDHGRSGG